VPAWASAAAAASSFVAEVTTKARFSRYSEIVFWWIMALFFAALAVSPAVAILTGLRRPH
jgi:hypothetical protein